MGQVLRKVRRGGRPDRDVHADEDATAARPRLLSRTLVLLFASAAGMMTSFYLLLSVVPRYATGAGAGGIGAGLATGALMLTTVAGEIATPRLVARFGQRPAFAAGLVLLGAPALGLTASSGLAAILAVCAARGLGFGIIVVLGAALVASVVPERRRAEGFGLYGVVVGVPSIVALPLGVWLTGQVGYGPVFVAGAAAALAGLAVVPVLPGRQPRQERPHGVLAGLRTPALARPAVAFFATTAAAGIVVTFLPLAVTGAGGGLAALALLVQSAAATGARWLTGRIGDRHGSARLLLPGVLAAAAGVLAMAASASPPAVLAGMLLFGTGFGISQNASLAVMFERTHPAQYGTASAVWNLAYDAGLGLGAAAYGVVAARTGFGLGFAITGLLMLGALLPAWRDRRPA